MLVVLEGLDGAGKSTQVKKLKAYLEKICPELEYIHFPRYDAPVYGDLISRFLRGISEATKPFTLNWSPCCSPRTGTGRPPR